MDGDGEIDIPFAASFPLPFRVLFLVGLGLLGWATNLHGLDLLGVDATGALGLRAAEGHRSPLPVNRSHLGFKLIPPPSTLYSPVYRIFATYSAWCLLAWSIFRYVTYVNIFLADVFRFVPALCALCILMVVVCPFDVCYKRERDMFLHTIWRCMLSPFGRPIYFSDVVFADILTSFAKVLGDVWLSVLMLLPGSSLLDLPTTQGWTRWILPSIMSLPYLVRFRQCLVEYMLPSNESRRPLYNALKYASSFPVIYLSAAQRLVVSDLIQEKGEEAAREAWHGEHPLFRLWLLAAAINSLYSFWWDVTNDWGLDLLKPQSSSAAITPPRPLVLPSLHSNSSSVTGSPHHSPSLSHEDAINRRTDFFSPVRQLEKPYPYGLRPTLLYPLPVYPLIIFLDLILRLTWSIKLSSHLHHQSEGSVVIFWLEMAEVLRRWMWVFIRVEWEVIKRARGGRVRASLDVGSAEEDEYELVSSAE